MSTTSRQNNTQLQTRKMIFAALALGLALVLPFLTGQIPEIGSMLSPMHIPVLLCGFICGWPWGLAVGLIAPILRSLLFGMPPMFPVATAMAFELATYGLVSGLLNRLVPKFPGRLYVVLVIAMIAGRIVWGVARLALAGLSGGNFTFEMFLSGAITTAIPGIILHLAIIPPIVSILERTGISLNKA